MPKSMLEALAAISVLLVLRACVIVIWRLCFHPLAKFPGPKLAAASRLYEFWYQGIKEFEFQSRVKAMHKVYGESLAIIDTSAHCREGPIVRISPYELSINDSDFNLEHFLKDRKLHKDPWYYTLGISESLFTLLDKNRHRHRQANLIPHFFGSDFADAVPIIIQEIKSLCLAFEDCAATTKELNLSLAYRTVSNEILRKFLLGEEEGTSPVDYMKNGDNSYHPVFKTMTYVRHFPLLYKIRTWVPDWWLTRYFPLAKYQRDAEDHIRSVINRCDIASATGKTTKAGVISHFIEHDQTYRESDSLAAAEDFIALQWGGREVLGHGLTNLSYYLATNPEIMDRLHKELQAADFDISTAGYSKLSQLPYLRAVCREAIRIQHGGNFRIPRVSKEPVQYRQWLIPAEVRPNVTNSKCSLEIQTPLSMCPNFFHGDETHFPDASTFKPERWLYSDSEVLETYWKPFGNGSRSCIGMK